MKRDDVRVIKVINADYNFPLFRVILAKEIENYAADGTSQDYSLKNEESTCWFDLSQELENRYPGVSFELGENNEICVDECFSEKEVSESELSEIRKFASDWLKEHEWHDDALYWNYFDGSNWKSELLSSKDAGVDDNKNYRLLDENDEEAEKIIDAYDRGEDAIHQWENGYFTYHDEETGYDVCFSQWSGHASMADIY